MTTDYLQVCLDALVQSGMLNVFTCHDGANQKFWVDREGRWRMQVKMPTNSMSSACNHHVWKARVGGACM